ncbi:MAG: hypothetical protein LWX83_00670 [Anaerolineae bacterium]|nr:hypothetical protein [Anaerolineae bacterium]
MASFFLGVDLGSSKTHALVSNGEGAVLGIGRSGPGNHEVVGYDGFQQNLKLAVQQALDAAGIKIEMINGAGFGVSGYDWDFERPAILNVINTLALNAPIEVVNDAVPGIVAAARDGWGLAVVSGTGCNCWGRDYTHSRLGHVTGGGTTFGEGAGASEIVARSIHQVAYQYTRRGPETLLSHLYMQLTGSSNLEELLSGLAMGSIHISPSAAPLVFKAAEAGDEVALNLLDWAGNELGELANAVIRQLSFEALTFDVVLVGSFFNGGDRLINPMRIKIHSLAPGANLVRLKQPPAIGAVLMGMEKSGVKITALIRENLKKVNQL